MRLTGHIQAEEAIPQVRVAAIDLAASTGLVRQQPAISIF